MIDERTEQLITRKLDGELTEGESHDLNKLLIRSPQVRALMEEYERADALAGEALRAAFEREASPDDRAAQLAPAAASRRRWRAPPRGITMAAAAALAVIVGGGLAHWLMPPDMLTPSDPARVGPYQPPVVAGAAPVEDNSVTVVIEGPRVRDQRVVRDVFGVFDEETQSVYLLEASRTRTNVVPVSANY